MAQFGNFKLDLLIKLKRNKIKELKVKKKSGKETPKKKKTNKQTKRGKPKPKYKDPSEDRFSVIFIQWVGSVPAFWVSERRRDDGGC